MRYLIIALILTICAGNCNKKIIQIDTVKTNTHDLVQPENKPQIVDEPDKVKFGDRFVHVDIPLSETVYFDFNDHNIKDEFYPKLNQLAIKLKTKKYNILVLKGGACPIGEAPYNHKLGMDRAKEVFEYLKVQGVQADKMIYISVGEGELVTHNETEYWKNRRCEISEEG